MEETITRMVGTAEDPVTRRKAREAAARYLESTGCGILESNWECAAGAIDVICDDGGTVAFVEVVAGYGRAGIQLSRCRIILDATAIAVKLCF